MRIHLTTSPNTTIVPFDYQQKLVGCLHKWIGEDNDQHDKTSLYSFSWLKNGKMKDNKGFDFVNGAKWFISFHDESIIKRIVTLILSDPDMFCGMRVIDICIEQDPDLSKRELFNCASPIFVKRLVQGQKNEKHYTYNDPESSELLKQTLVTKMREAGIAEDETLEIRFDTGYNKKREKMMTYKGIKNKVNLCPIIIKGKVETKLFAWNVGVGNSTGIGLGAII
ncbi:MAG: CRISPR-associated endoribonuclease Cas6 [Bacteroidales bacterium]